MAHLLRRAGFGASQDELSVYLQLGWDAAIDRLVNYDQVPNDAVNAQADAAEQKILADWDHAKMNQPPLAGYQQLWLTRMLTTARPLEEKMTLFWHDHFATGNAKVGNPPAMYTQNKLFRSNALGNFHDLVTAIAQDPAMLRWLDSNSNRKAHPNENFGRELMELFTLGVGNYSESDVREGARAFTGWFYDPKLGFVFNKNQHDTANKTFLGQTGAWNGDDVINIIFQQPALSTYMANKLFNFFVHDHPSPSTISSLADTFRSSGFSVRALVRAILTSPDFTSDDAYRGVVRSPIELVVGTLKSLGVSQFNASATLGSLRRMGMDLYNPPNVAGWDWGSSWISSATQLERFAAAMTVTSARGDSQQYGLDPSAFLAQTGAKTPESIVDAWLGLLVDGAVTNDVRGALVDYARNGYTGDPTKFTADSARVDRAVRGVGHLIMSTPIYQMA
jgi:uncharacterized protein (DUF1800 family)